MVEGRFAGEEFISKNACTPHVNFFSIAFAFDYLGGDVVSGSTVGLPALITEGSPSEIA